MIYVLSGGTSLNFKVVGGTTQPTTASENTIWVNTSTSITSWVFSATQPASPASGMVWFATDTTASASFNALKKNGIFIYPTGCKQYISGAWVDKEASTYQNSVWLKWYEYLMKSGTLTDLGAGLGTNVTGGWTGYGNASISYTAGSSIYLNGNVNKNAEGSSTHTTNTIDLTPYKELRAHISDVTFSGPNPGVFNIFVGGTSAWQGSGGTRAASIGFGLNELNVGDTVILDISSVNAAYYVCLAISNSGNTTAQGGSVNIDEIYFY